MSKRHVFFLVLIGVVLAVHGVAAAPDNLATDHEKPVMLYGFDGSAWDRLRGTSTTGLDVQITGTASGAAIQVRRLAPTSRTYRATFVVDPAIGTAVELRGPSSGTAEITEIVLQSDVALTLTINRRSTLSTGGTSSDRTNVANDPGDAAANLVVRQFTADPAEGTLVGAIESAEIAANGTYVGTFGDHINKPLTMTASTNAFTLEIDANATLVNGHIQWIER